jgi:uncharacterized phage protein (TIGR02218 family)
MTYDVQEFSVKGGRPYFLYQFARGATVTRLASSPVALIVGGYTWEASAVMHDTLEQGGNVERSELEIQLPLSDPFGIALLSPQTAVMTVTVFRGHYSDASNELRQYWKGRVVGARSSGTSISVKTENVFTSLRRPGCRVRVQRTCRHDLYGRGCNLNRNDWDIAATITAMSGLNLTVPVADGYPDGKFRAGMVEWNSIFGFIQVHSGSTLQLITDIPGLDDAVAEADQACKIYPGCDRSLTGEFGCTSFNNHLNYGGFRWIPDSNPFTYSVA